ncbi:MAG: response regulator [Pseudanabaenaceae cyanobacterium]
MPDRTAANLPPDTSSHDPGVESADATPAAQTQLQTQLQTQIEQLEAERDELKLLLETTTDHADAVEEELFRLNQQLGAEVQERAKVEASLRVSEAIARSLVKVLQRDKYDLEMLLETATQHGDVVGNVLLERQRRAEVENQNLFYAIAETIPLGLGICRFADGRLVYANEAFEEIVGLTPSQILSKCLQDLPLVPEEGQALVATLREQGTIAECELEIGEGPRWGSFTVRPLVLQGEAVHLVVLQDITARKLAEEGLRQSEAHSRDLLRDLEAIVERRTAALKEAMEAAAAANRAKSEFLASMSHELRTPLNAILGFAQLIQQDETFPVTHGESLEAIARAGEHLLGTIDDVLELSRIESGRLSLRETSFDLRALLDDLKRMMSLRARSKNLELQFEVDDRLPRYLIADAGKLRQIAINLLGNAVKFTNKGSITLQVTGEPLAEGGDRNYRLQICVEDTGSGIAPEEMAGLFEPFVQTASGRRSQEGSGLGLTVSRKYARLMGGDLTATSQVGRGTRFLLVVATRAAKAAETTQGLRPIGLVPGQVAYRILTIDDRPEMRTIVRRLLETVGFEIRDAATAQEALQVWQTWQPHLIWMDLQMPGCDGFQLTREIRRREQQQGRSPTVIVALSARVFAEDRAAALAAGCDDFVSKPFLRDTLLEKISQHLGATYTYAEPRAPEREVMVDDLQDLDREWVRQLHQAATLGDSERLHQLIAHLSSVDATLQQGLQELVKALQFDRLFDLTVWAMTPIPIKARPDILVVEDNRVNQKIALRMLQNLGQVADCVSSGAEALAHLREHPYRLVLMDLQMEEMDGIATTLALRALESTQPNRPRAIVVALTASTDSTSREACLNAGMDDFLSKPFQLAALQELLARWCP